MTEGAPRESRRYRHEKDEKEEEKKHEKEEKTRGEKNWEEKWRRDPINAGCWAAILIWAGLVLLAENLGWVNQWNWWQTWPVIFMGVGVIILLCTLIRLVMPAYRRAVSGGLIPGLIFLGIGIAWCNNWEWDLIWPIILIAIGLAIVLSGLLRRRR